MAIVTRSHDQLLELLDEQLHFLKASCRAYDEGLVGEVKRLAVTVRVLVHDTQKSKSLLFLLDQKNKNFLDTAIPYDDENILTHSSLVYAQISKAGSSVKPHLDDSASSNFLSFDNWWNGIVLVDRQKNEFSRKDITLFLANKEGGAHVDHEIDEIYDRLRQENTFGWYVSTETGVEIQGFDHVPATMRQIAHELIKTLDGTYVCHRRADSGALLNISGVTVKPVDPNDLNDEFSFLPNLRKNRPEVGTKKLGRNDPCTCGSGKKYKKCCIYK